MTYSNVHGPHRKHEHPFEFLVGQNLPHRLVSQGAAPSRCVLHGRVTDLGLGGTAPPHWTESYAAGGYSQGVLSLSRSEMQWESLAAVASRLKLKCWLHNRTSVEAEIGSERDRELNALLGVSSFRECDNRFCQSCGSWCREGRRREHRNEPCAGDSEHRRRRQKLKH